MTNRYQQITQADIDRVNARKARLEPIATANGLVYDDNNEEQVEVLTALASLRDQSALAAKRRSTATGTSNGKPSNGASAPPANLTVMDQTVELMHAKRAGREPAAWATTPLNSGGK